eukprot:scaffold1867_cov186-Chaetoceros_neogracile.AAC.11
MVANMVNRLCSIGACSGTQREPAGNHDMWGGLGGNVPSWEFEGMDDDSLKSAARQRGCPAAASFFFKLEVYRSLGSSHRLKH